MKFGIRKGSACISWLPLHFTLYYNIIHEYHKSNNFLRFSDVLFVLCALRNSIIQSKILLRINEIYINNNDRIVKISKYDKHAEKCVKNDLNAFQLTFKCNKKIVI